MTIISNKGRLIYSGPDDQKYENNLMIWKYGYGLSKHDINYNVINEVHEFDRYVVFNYSDRIRLYDKYRKQIIYVSEYSFKHVSMIYKNDMFIVYDNTRSYLRIGIFRPDLCEFSEDVYGSDINNNIKASLVRYINPNDESALIMPKILYNIHDPTYRVVKNGFNDLLVICSE